MLALWNRILDCLGCKPKPREAGRPRAKNRRNFPKLASDSSTCSGDSLTVEVGLDGLPPHKQHRRSLGNNHSRIVSVEKSPPRIVLLKPNLVKAPRTVLSADEPEMRTMSSSGNLVRHHRVRSTESSVSREAKKRLSERWKVTHRSQDRGEISTLGEMLAIPDRLSEVMSANPSAQIGEGCSSKYSVNDGAAGWVEPLGISSRDGWKQPVSELQSPASSEEADQPSPASILEAPFIDDLSRVSKCFENISADLHGLRTQLQLLKLGSETYTEGPLLVSSDDDVEEKSIGSIDERNMLKTEDNWESSYLANILINSGFYSVNTDTFITTCHSPECPINPSVFEELEKKYRDLAFSSRLERKIIFDSINAQLVEIHQQFVNPVPWLRLGRTLMPTWGENGLRDHLQKLLFGNKNTAEKELGPDAQWLDIGNDIDMIGSEIEKLLIDELVDELVSDKVKAKKTECYQEIECYLSNASCACPQLIAPASTYPATYQASRRIQNAPVYSHSNNLKSGGKIC